MELWGAQEVRWVAQYLGIISSEVTIVLIFFAA